MKKILLTMGSIVALAAAPALADPGGGGHGGNGGGNGGGMGNAGGMDHSMGNGPPMTPPGQTGDARGAAADIASQRGEYGRALAADRQATQAQQARAFRDQLNHYRSSSNERRDAALAQAAALKAGRGVNAKPDDIRDDLKEDMEAWRDQFRIGRADWQKQRDQWLAERDGMTAADWAARRADWFAARDAWIAKQVDWAQARGGDATDDGDDDN